MVFINQLLSIYFRSTPHPVTADKEILFIFIKGPKTFTESTVTGWVVYPVIMGLDLSGDSWMYPGPMVPRHGKFPINKPYISRGYLWVSYPQESQG